MAVVTSPTPGPGGFEAVIVAGGLGTRMLPLTERRPKHLLPVAGRPFVAHQLAKLASSGARRVILATSYQAEMFGPTLGDGSAWGVELV
jgi:mannose-1-phosphate guanylyltransferase